MPLQPHTPEWYDRLATLQPGYYYPWRSRPAAWNGEDARWGRIVTCVVRVAVLRPTRADAASRAWTGLRGW